LGGAIDGENYIHEIRVKPTKQNLPKLICIHGFGGGGAQFFGMMPLLQNYFEVVTVDMLGMGASGRPEYNQYDCDGAVDYFIDSIKEWFDRTKSNEEEFYLLGHSFGGYIATAFALRYPENLKKLILMSAVGISTVPKSFQPETWKSELQKAGFWTGYGGDWAGDKWD